MIFTRRLQVRVSGSSAAIVQMRKCEARSEAVGMATIKFKDKEGKVRVKKIPGFGFIDCTDDEE
jgi:hypothetical protein